MSSDFMRQFLVGWRMGQDKLQNQRSAEQEAYNRQQDEFKRQQDLEDRAKQAELWKIRKQEADLEQKKALFEAKALQASMLSKQQEVAPAATEDWGAGTVMQMGPTTQEREPMTAQIPGTEGPPVPLPYKEDIEAQRVAESQRKMRELLGMETAKAEALEPYKIADDERAADLAAQRDMAVERRYTARQQAEEKKRKGNATALRTEYNRQIKPYVEQIDQYNKAKATAALPDEQRTPADDISLVFLYMKSLDPSSTVREGEYATAKNAAGIPERVRNAYNATIKGTFLSPEQRKSFAATIERNFASGPGASVARLQKRYDFLARDAGIDPELVLMDSGLAGDADDGGGWETVGGVRVRRKARP